MCLYASNIAACIGMNPFKKPHKALEEMCVPSSCLFHFYVHIQGQQENGAYGPFVFLKAEVMLCQVHTHHLPPLLFQFLCRALVTMLVGGCSNFQRRTRVLSPRLSAR